MTKVPCFICGTAMEPPRHANTTCPRCGAVAEMALRTTEQYEADKAAGMQRIGEPVDGKHRNDAAPDDKPLFPPRVQRDDDDVLPPLAPRDWRTEEEKEKEEKRG